MDTVLRFLRTRGLQRGVLGSSRGWLGIWVALTVARQLNKRLGKEAQLVERIVLKPGQAIQVVDTGVPWKDDPEAPTSTRKRRGRKSTA